MIFQYGVLRFLYELLRIRSLSKWGILVLLLSTTLMSLDVRLRVRMYLSFNILYDLG